MQLNLPSHRKREERGRIRWQGIKRLHLSELTMLQRKQGDKLCLPNREVKRDGEFGDQVSYERTEAMHKSKSHAKALVPAKTLEWKTSR